MVVVDQRGAVGLLGFDRANMLGLLDGLVRKLAGWLEFQPQAALFNGEVFLQIAQQERDEDLIGRDIEQSSLARALAYRCKRARIIALAIEAHPFDPHR